MRVEQELKELMGLVDSHGNACENFGDYQTIKNADVCIERRNGIESRLRALLAELDAAREDARKNKVDAECFRWWVHEAEANPSLVAKAISHCITEDDYRQVICGAMEAKNAVIDAARKGDA